MSERTTIGGTVYEAVGSSSSNLLLKCNGTARIQWGNKLIDLIKNGKIASGESSEKISVVSNESDITSDGIYILNSDKSSQLLIRKNSTTYNLTNTELYISASTKQDTTVEQKTQALENIGMYYNTLDDVNKAGIQNGLVYVLENQNLYTIKNGAVSEFEAKLKTVSVEKEEQEGEIISSSVKIVLSILDVEYLVLENKRINAKQDIYVSNSAKICSETASESNGYRLYIDQGKSYLEVDYLKLRHPEETPDYINTTFADLDRLVSNKKLKPQNWYLISDYYNPWRFPNAVSHYRPILVKAVTNDSIHPEGCLFANRLVTIKYDFNFRETLGEEKIITPGLITWMKDEDNNEANFDFLDYADANNIPLATQHFDLIKNVSGSYTEGAKSIFPKGSYNNKLTVRNLRGLVIKDGEIDYENSSVIDFNFPDSISASEEISDVVIASLPTMQMHDNVIDCYGLSTTSTCTKFYNNTMSNVGNVQFEGDCIRNNLTFIYSSDSAVMVEDLSAITLTKTIFSQGLVDVNFNSFVNSSCSGYLQKTTFDSLANVVIEGNIVNSTFDSVSDSTLKASFTKCSWKNITTSTFEEGYIENVTCRSNVYSVTVSEATQPILYDTTRVKDVYFVNGEFAVTDSSASNFARGMIVMHYGNAPIPDGWAICDGQSHTHNGIVTETPDLRGRFIKAVVDESEIGKVDVHNNGESNDFTLEEMHLPEHSHPHAPHTHTLSDFSVTIGESGDLSVVADTGAMTKTEVTLTEVVSELTGVEEGSSLTTKTVNVIDGIEDVLSSVGSTGGNHTHSVDFTTGTASETTSTESEKVWSNQSFKIEPNYYSLIFIIKL